MFSITPSVVNKHWNPFSLTVTCLSAVSVCPHTIKVDWRGVRVVSAAMSRLNKYYHPPNITSLSLPVLQACPFHLPVISHFPWSSRDGNGLNFPLLSPGVVTALYLRHPSTHLDLGSYSRHYRNFRNPNHLPLHANNFPVTMVMYHNHIIKIALITSRNHFSSTASKLVWKNVYKICFHKKTLSEKSQEDAKSVRFGGVRGVVEIRGPR